MDLDDTEQQAYCSKCGNPYPRARADIGIMSCMPCGEKESVAARKSWTVAPLHKSNYTLITDRKDLVGLNNKGGLVRGPL